MSSALGTDLRPVVHDAGGTITIPSALINRLALAFAGVSLIFAASTLAGTAVGANKSIVVVSLFVHLAAFTLLGLAAFRRNPKHADVLILVAVLVTLASFYFLTFVEDPRSYIADTLAFTHTSAEMVLDGNNPYSAKGADVVLQSAADGKVTTLFITMKADGDPAERLLSYPAGLLYPYIAAAGVGLADMRWVGATATLLAIVVLWWQAPIPIRPFAVFAILLSPAQTYLEPAFGIVDAVWLLPMMGVVIAMNRGRYDSAALFFGLAISVKQQPWVIAPFLLIWLWQESSSLSASERRLRLARFSAIAVSLFVLVNLPFIIWNVRDWFTAIIGPYGTNLTVEGVGLSTLTTGGILHIDSTTYNALAGAVFLILIPCYFKYYANLKHTVWLFPAVILWFTYRGLTTYFTFWLPLLLLSLFVMWRTQSSDPVDAEPRGPDPLLSRSS